MSANLGAHEVMEIHEVLTGAVDTINQFQLYRPHVTDQQLGTILDKHQQFMTQEYNNMVQAINAQRNFHGYPLPRPYDDTAKIRIKQSTTTKSQYLTAATQ